MVTPPPLSEHLDVEDCDRLSNMPANWLLFSVKRDNPHSSLYKVHMVTKGREVGRWRGPARSALNFRWGGLIWKIAALTLIWDIFPHIIQM